MPELLWVNYGQKMEDWIYSKHERMDTKEDSLIFLVVEHKLALHWFLQLMINVTEFLMQNHLTGIPFGSKSNGFSQVQGPHLFSDFSDASMSTGKDGLVRHVLIC